MAGIRKKDLKRLKRDLKNPIFWGEDFDSSKYYFGDEVLNFLLNKIPEKSTVVELGGGKSTFKLAKYYKVYTVEDCEKYLNLVEGVTYINAPLISYFDRHLNLNSKWYDRGVLKKKLPDKYDILIVDGPEVSDFPLGRYGVARYYSTLFNSDAPVLMDDLQVPYIYMTALHIARVKKSSIIEVRITKDNRVFGWID